MLPIAKKHKKILSLIQAIKLGTKGYKVHYKEITLRLEELAMWAEDEGYFNIWAAIDEGLNTKNWAFLDDAADKIFLEMMQESAQMEIV